MTSIFGVTISRSRFAKIMAGSPALEEAGPDTFYDICLKYNIDPAFAAAVAKKEHDIFRNMNSVQGRNTTKAFANQRSHQLYKGADIITDPIRKSNYAKFGSYLAGLEDFLYRVTTPTYVYAKEGRTTVAAVIERLAPASDGNDPKQYTATVEALMARWRDVKPGGGVQPSIREHLITSQGQHRPNLPLVPQFITVHETGNPRAGANAAMHRAFVQNGGGTEHVSFHWCVDDKECVHILDDDEVGWHAGDGYDGPGNRKSIAIETCVNAGGDWARTTEHLAQLIAYLMARHGIMLGNVVQHHRWSGKNCPTKLRRVGWSALLGRVAELVNAGGGIPITPPVERGFPGIVLPSGRLQINGELAPDGYRLAQAAEVHVIGPNDEGRWYRVIWRNHNWEVEAIA